MTNDYKGQMLCSTFFCLYDCMLSEWMLLHTFRLKDGKKLQLLNVMQINMYLHTTLNKKYQVYAKFILIF